MLSCPGRLWEDKTKCESFALALGNLSAANFEDRSYFESRANVEVLLKCCRETLSEEKISKFTKRSEQCSKHLGQYAEYFSNPLPAWDLERFSIVYEETGGRNGMALKDIKFGDILLIDKPVVMRSKVGKQFCTHCLGNIKAGQIYKSPYGSEVSLVNS